MATSSYDKAEVYFLNFLSHFNIQREVTSIYSSAETSFSLHQAICIMKNKNNVQSQ